MNQIVNDNYIECKQTWFSAHSRLNGLSSVFI